MGCGFEMLWSQQSRVSPYLLSVVRALAAGLTAAGLSRGQHMVVIGANRPRLYASMLAAQSVGAIPVPLYQDAASAELVFPISNA